ncbi:MAG TPA: helix-turn-helix transcriptional regulator [Geminicoccaceae bacterium]|nr:helix-turn-helix transcriptional regulator [Geminicoccaceae bacterium]
MNQVAERNLLELIERCYAAVADPEGWGAFLAAVARSFDASVASVTTMSRQTRRIDWGATHGLAAADATERRAGELHNPRVELTRRLIGPGRAYSFDASQDVDGFKRSPFYVHHHRRLDLLWAVIAWLDDGRDFVGGWSLHRPERMPCFTALEVQHATLLGRHIGRARQLQVDLERARAQASLSRQALDHLPVGLVFLGGGARILDMNATARAILDDADGIGLRGSQLRIDDPATHRALARLIDGASRGLADGFGSVVQVPRPSGRTPYVLSVTRCFTDLAELLGRPAAALLSIADPARAVAASPAALRALWDLTASEAQIAIALARGLRLDEIAAQSRISRETARVHLKRILAKTGAHRQSELVRMIVGGPEAVLKAG